MGAFHNLHEPLLGIENTSVFIHACKLATWVLTQDTTVHEFTCWCFTGLAILLRSSGCKEKLRMVFDTSRGDLNAVAKTRRVGVCENDVSKPAVQKIINDEYQYQLSAYLG